MNPTSTDPLAPPPPPPLPSQPPRSSFSCDRHPEEQFSGFCPSCLCERLTTLDISNNPTSSSRRPSTSSSSAAAAAIKSLFTSSKPPPSFSAAPPAPKQCNKPSSSSFLPELRRTKSFSASKHEGLFGINFSGGAFEPQRKSCDVRGRNTLWSLFSQDDESKNPSSGKPSTSSAKEIVLELKEEEDDDFEEEDPDFQEGEISNISSNNNENVVDEITPVIEEIRAEERGERGDISLEIVEQEEGLDLREIKPMKDHIDLDSQAKKSSSGGGGGGMAGSFWSAASVFSKKWNNWRRKQKLKKRNNEEGNSAATLPVEKPISRQYRETQSEIADYGFGRRSCDTDPRFSLDAGRISFDDPRYSFDEPRASWDGYLIGKSFPRMPMPPMVSVVEDAPVVAHVPRSDTTIPVEEPAVLMNGGDVNVPGGSAQTREYYSDSSSSSRRRKSLDRSNSIRKTAAAVVAEIDEMKSVSNAKVLPSSTIDCVNGGTKVLVGGEKDIRYTNSNSNSLRDDCSETFELGGGFRDNASVVGGNGEQKGSSKKSRRWSWKLWGFIQRRSAGNKDEDDDRYSRANGVERSLSESWPELRRDGNSEVRGGLNRKVFRSNSSVSWRHSNNMGVSFGSVRNLGMDMNGNGNGKKKRDEFILERNRSARYSPNNVDNGLLRFYLTPMRSGRRGAPAKTRPNSAHSIARSVLRLY